MKALNLFFAGFLILGSTLALAQEGAVKTDKTEVTQDKSGVQEGSKMTQTSKESTSQEGKSGDKSQVKKSRKVMKSGHHRKSEVKPKSAPEKTEKPSDEKSPKS